MASIPPATATAAAWPYIRGGPQRDEIMTLIRLGARFRAAQCGRRPGELASLVLDCASRAGPPYTFARLLDQFDLLAARRAIEGERASCVEGVDRIFELLTIHTRSGRVQVPFATARNHLTVAKKKLQAEIPG